MKMSGTRQMQAPQAEVWEKLNDVDVLKRCIPGCEVPGESRRQRSEIDGRGQDRADERALQRRRHIVGSRSPNSYRISGKGQGGAAGFASGGANVKLESKDGGTLLTYDVDATVGGKIAQLGARLIDATAASLANQFFDRFAAEVGLPAQRLQVRPPPMPATPSHRPPRRRLVGCRGRAPGSVNAGKVGDVRQHLGLVARRRARCAGGLLRPAPMRARLDTHAPCREWGREGAGRHRN